MDYLHSTSSCKRNAYQRFLHYAPELDRGNRLSLGFGVTRAVCEGVVLIIIQVALLIFKDTYRAIRWRENWCWRRPFGYHENRAKVIKHHCAAIAHTIQLFCSLWREFRPEGIENNIQNLPKEYFHQKMNEWLICDSKEAIVFGKEQIDFIKNRYLQIKKPLHKNQNYTLCVFASPKYKRREFRPLEANTPLFFRTCFVPTEKKETLIERFRKLGLSPPIFIDDKLSPETRISFENFPKMPFLIEGWICGLADETNDFFPYWSEGTYPSHANDFNAILTGHVPGIWRLKPEEMDYAKAKEFTLFISLIELELEDEIMPNLIDELGGYASSFYESYENILDERFALSPISAGWTKLHARFISKLEPKTWEPVICKGKRKKHISFIPIDIKNGIIELSTRIGDITPLFLTENLNNQNFINQEDFPALSPLLTAWIKAYNRRTRQDYDPFKHPLDITTVEELFSWTKIYGAPERFVLNLYNKLTKCRIVQPDNPLISKEELDYCGLVAEFYATLAKLAKSKNHPPKDVDFIPICFKYDSEIFTTFIPKNRRNAMIDLCDAFELTYPLFLFDPQYNNGLNINHYTLPDIDPFFIEFIQTFENGYLSDFFSILYLKKNNESIGINTFRANSKLDLSLKELETLVTITWKYEPQFFSKNLIKSLSALKKRTQDENQLLLRLYQNDPERAVTWLLEDTDCPQKELRPKITQCFVRFLSGIKRIHTTLKMPPFLKKKILGFYAFQELIAPISK